MRIKKIVCVGGEGGGALSLPLELRMKTFMRFLCRNKQNYLVIIIEYNVHTLSASLLDLQNSHRKTKNFELKHLFR